MADVARRCRGVVPANGFTIAPVRLATHLVRAGGAPTTGIVGGVPKTVVAAVPAAAAMVPVSSAANSALEVSFSAGTSASNKSPCKASERGESGVAATAAQQFVPLPMTPAATRGSVLLHPAPAPRAAAAYVRLETGAAQRRQEPPSGASCVAATAPPGASGPKAPAKAPARAGPPLAAGARVAYTARSNGCLYSGTV